MVSKTKKKQVRRYRPRNKGPLVLFRPLVFLLFILALVLFSCSSLMKPPTQGLSDSEIHIEIPPNTTTAEIGNLLQQGGVVKSARVFRLYTRAKGLDGSLKAGDYWFAGGLYLNEVLDKMIQGEPSLCTFTIPEGYTIAQIADSLEKAGLVKMDDFYFAAGQDNFAYAFLGGLPPGENRLEGYLFPDTYTVRKDSSAKEVLEVMLNRFDEKMRAMDYSAKVATAGLNLHKAITIASMIEREAQVADERALISGVIHNRLARGMLLQIDATVLYALGGHKPVVSLRDLEIESPYNTYRVAGLPPGPIASPGEACMLAAVEPAKTDYLYYCARPDGSHAFARTLNEHNANVRKYINN